MDRGFCYPPRMSDRTIERAFQLARSGELRTLDELRARLRREQHGSIDQHLSGMSIKAQLKKLMAAAQP